MIAFALGPLADSFFRGRSAYSITSPVYWWSFKRRRGRHRSPDTAHWSLRAPPELLPPPQPPEQEKQRNQGQREEQRTSCSVDDAVDHVRAIIHTQQSNDHDAEAVTKKAERDHSEGENSPPPRTPQKQVSGEQTRNEKDITRSDATALLRHLKGNSG